MSEPVIGVEAAEHIVAQWQARTRKAEAAHEILHAMMEAAQDMMGQAQDERDAEKAARLKAEADAKGWEEMHDKAAKSRNKLQNLFVNAVDGREKAEEALREILARLEECPCTDATEPFVVEMQNIARAALVELPTDFPEEARIRFNDLSEKGE